MKIIKFYIKIMYIDSKLYYNLIKYFKLGGQVKIKYKKFFISDF